jgi:hypothetical protein
LYLGEKKGGYKLHSVGKKAVFGPDDGGTMGDPFQGVDFDQKKKVLSIAVYGGSSHRWSGIYKYRFQKNDLHLIGTDRAYFWIPKGADVLKVETNYMTKKYHHIQTYKGKKTIRKHYDSMLVPISLAQFDAFMGEKHVKNILSKYYPY